jgi:hypothetical protein
MNTTTKSILAVFLATAWVSISEFARNEFILKSIWFEHYTGLGLVFPSEPLNGAVWGVWSLMFAIAVYFISRRFNLLETTLIAWLVGFVLMWLVTWNLGVFPPKILWVAVPLSLLECFVAAVIIQKLTIKKSKS